MGPCGDQWHTKQSCIDWWVGPNSISIFGYRWWKQTKREELRYREKKQIGRFFGYRTLSAFSGGRRVWSKPRTMIERQNQYTWQVHQMQQSNRGKDKKKLQEKKGGDSLGKSWKAHSTHKKMYWFQMILQQSKIFQLCLYSRGTKRKMWRHTSSSY